MPEFNWGVWDHVLMHYIISTECIIPKTYTYTILFDFLYFLQHTKGEMIIHKF